jgi:uncharacterized membrane protein (DUF485 family)
VPERVESTNPDGVDFGWVMQITFVTTILVGAPVVAALSAFVRLPTWGARVGFAVRVGAAVWLVTIVVAYLYARRTAGEPDTGLDADADAPTDPVPGDRSSEAEVASTSTSTSTSSSGTRTGSGYTTGSGSDRDPGSDDTSESRAPE